MSRRIDDPIIERLIKNNYITEDWGYFSKKAFKIFYRDIVPKLKAIEVDTFPESTTDIFKAFKLTPLDSVKVIIIGQDPYHDGSATGLAFDNTWVKALSKKGMSPSLRNIITEMGEDLDHKIYVEQGEETILQHLTSQGVLLLNAALTVEKRSPISHFPMWKDFTTELISSLNEKDNIVWVLWGRFAQQFKPLITNETHEIIEGVHPSPFSANGKGEGTPKFFGSKPFSKVNSYLKEKGLKQIIW